MNKSIKALPLILNTKLTNHGFTCVLASNYSKSFFSAGEHDTLTSDHSETQAASTNLNKNDKCADFNLKRTELISKAVEGSPTPISLIQATSTLSSLPSKHYNSETDELSVISKEQAELEERLPPEPPIYCCGTGCPNCSWIIYAEELKNYFNNDINKAKISLELDKIKDPSVRMFVKMELGL